MANAQPGTLEVQGAFALSLAGMGRDNARHAALALVRAGVRGLISFGTAGALKPEFRSGTLTVSADFVSPDAAPLCSPASLQLARRLGERIGCRTVRLATVSAPVQDRAGRLALALATGADCVDLETHHIAAVALAAGLPCIAIRSILDDCDTILPAGLTQQVDDYGRPKPGLLLWLLANPGRCWGLLGLARQLGLAQSTLRAVGRGLADQLKELEGSIEVASQ